MKSLCWILPFCLSWAGFPAEAVAAAVVTAPPVVSAKARWEVDYGKTKCRLIRHSGESEGAYRLAIDRDWTFGGYQWALYGSTLPFHSSMKSVEIVLGSDSDARRFKLDSYAVTEGEERRLAWHDADGLVFGALRDGDQIRVTAPRKLDVSLKFANLGAAIKALETCENDMFASWGFDAQQIRSLSAHAAPSNNAGRWVTNDDYPQPDFGRKNEGMTTFLLTVDAKGAATNCRIVDSSGFPSLDQRTCTLLLARSTFSPARDGSGQAVAGFYINRVRWQVPR
jgi:TonB family protein